MCYPPFSEGSGFRHESRLECQPGDAETSNRVDQLLHILARHEIPQSCGWAPGTYFFEADRKYEMEDLDGAGLLLVNIQPIEVQFEHERDADGRLILLPRKLKRGFVMGCIYPNHLVVSDNAMNLISAVQFDGIEFREVAIPINATADPSQVIWEVWSSKVLPKMANTYQFQVDDQSGQLPFRGDYSKRIVISDPPYRGEGEVHYRRHDIEDFGKFDLASTHEIYLSNHPALVASQRFYQFCQKNKIPLDVRPVRIDLD